MVRLVALILLTFILSMTLLLGKILAGTIGILPTLLLGAYIVYVLKHCSTDPFN